MNRSLKMKLKKLGIKESKVVTSKLPISESWFKASTILSAIKTFLTENNVEDADIQIEIQGYDSYFDCMLIKSTVDKTEEQLEEEVAKVEAAIEQQRIKEEKVERELYLKLQKKFGEVTSG